MISLVWASPVLCVAAPPEAPQADAYTLAVEVEPWTFARAPAPALFNPWTLALGDAAAGPVDIPDEALSFAIAEGPDFDLDGSDLEARMELARRLMREDIAIPPLRLGDTPHTMSHLLKGQGSAATPIDGDPEPGTVFIRPLSISDPDASVIHADSSSVSLEWDLAGRWALRGTGERRAIDDEIQYVAVSAEAAYGLGHAAGLRIGYDLFRQELPGDHARAPDLPQERVFMEFRWEF